MPHGIEAHEARRLLTGVLRFRVDAALENRYIQSIINEQACQDDFACVRCDSYASIADRHGRYEERYVTVMYDRVGLPGLTGIGGGGASGA